MRDMSDSEDSRTPIKFETGGLGHLMVTDVYEVWVCIAGHECSEHMDEVITPFRSAVKSAPLLPVEWSCLMCCLLCSCLMSACAHNCKACSMFRVLSFIDRYEHV